MMKWMASDWFGRFLAGFALGLVATVLMSSGTIHPARASADHSAEATAASHASFLSATADKLR